MLNFAGFELDERRAELRAPDGKVVKLRRKSFELLRLLARNAGRILGKEEIAEAVWPKVHVGDDSLYQCVREIRSVLGDENRQLLRAVSGRGYLLDADVAQVDEDHAPLRFAGRETAQPAATAVSDDGDAQPAAAATHPAGETRRFLSVRSVAVVIIGIAACTAGLTFSAPLISSLVLPRKPVVAMTPAVAASTDPDEALAAANLTDRLTNGLSGIPNIRVLAHGPEQIRDRATAAGATAPRPDFVVRSEVQRGGDRWLVRARMIRASTGEVQWSASHSVAIEGRDPLLTQDRLASGIGYALALRLSGLVHSDRQSGDAGLVVEQAAAFINRTSRENFATAQAMLEKAVAARPDDVDLQAALAAHLLRGIQTVWYSPAEGVRAERRARDLLERAVRVEPDYVPVLQGYCRFLTATNAFVEALVACARALKFNPWDGLVLYHMGLAQLQLGRFEDALEMFERADRVDVPQVSRWTWLLGAGLASLVLDRNDEAVAWLQRSIAVTPGTGRTHFLLAAAYRRLGRTAEAREAVAAGLALRPGSTGHNIALPTKNANERYLAKSQEIKALLVEAGLPKE